MLRHTASRSVRQVARRPRAGRGGSVLVYSMLLMMVLLALVSLAVDYGHVQTVKTELQRCADATARGVLEQYAQSTTPDPTTISGWNSVDAGSGIAPTVSVTWGWWNASSNTFTTGSGSPVAVKVTVSRTAVGANAVPLTFALLGGASFSRVSCDVSATSIAYLTPASTTTTTVPSRSDLWLAGMPAGSKAGDTDTTSNAPATLALNVTPGSVPTFGSPGTTSGNVPPNATRLFLGTFDQEDNNDNRGSLSVTITKIARVTTVK